MLQQVLQSFVDEVQRLHEYAQILKLPWPSSHNVQQEFSG